MTTRRSHYRWFVVLLLLGTIAMWVRSYYRVDSIHWSDSQHFASLVSSGGRVNLTWSDWGGKTAWRGGWTVDSNSRTDAPPHWETLQHNNGRRRFLGFEWTHGIFPFAEARDQPSFFVPLYSLYAVPYWSISLLIAGPLVVRAIYLELRRRRRVGRSHCGECGYDLRATPDRCPECGTPVTPKRPRNEQVATIGVQS